MFLRAPDAFCAEQDPPHDGLTLHASDCHACLFSGETSCERSNRYLDRAVLVETVESRVWSSLAGQRLPTLELVSEAVRLGAELPVDIAFEKVCRGYRPTGIPTATEH